MLKVNEYEDITQIMLGRDVQGAVYYWVAAYHVDGLLIDTGCHYTAEELVACLKGKRIDCVVNTHFHEDHVGANHLLQQHRGLDIYAHPDAIPLIDGKAEIHPYQELVWGYPEPTKTKPIPECIQTERYAFQVLETPGHSVGHVVLFEPDKGWCFSGDIFVSETQKVLRADEDIFTLMESLRRMLTLPSEKLALFTSIGQMYDDGKASIRRYLHHLDDLREKVQEFRAHGLTAEATRDRIYGRESQLERLTEGHYSILNLIGQLMKPTPSPRDA